MESTCNGVLLFRFLFKINGNINMFPVVEQRLAA